MKFRALLAVAMLVLLSSLTACGGSDELADSDGPDVIEGDEVSYGVIALKCRDGLMAVDLPIGSTQELDGTSYQLSQKTKKDFKDEVQQLSVTLMVKLNKQTSLPAIIVHAVEGTGHSGASGPLDDKSLNVKVATGGSGSYELPTNAYVEYLTLLDAISGVTLCLDVSNAKPGASSS